MGGNAEVAFVPALVVEGFGFALLSKTEGMSGAEMKRADGNGGCWALCCCCWDCNCC
jgi:hypothetical protein